MIALQNDKILSKIYAQSEMGSSWRKLNFWKKKPPAGGFFALNRLQLTRLPKMLMKYPEQKCARLSRHGSGTKTAVK